MHLLHISCGSTAGERIGVEANFALMLCSVVVTRTEVRVVDLPVNEPHASIACRDVDAERGGAFTLRSTRRVKTADDPPALHPNTHMICEKGPKTT